MNWQVVKKFRDEGQLEQARQLALEILEGDPSDFRTKSQYEWVIYAFIKLIVANMDEQLEKGTPVAAGDVERLMARMEEYRGLDPRLPELTCSNMLRQIVKVASHLPKFPGLIYWVGIDRLRAEDWLPNEFEGKTSASLAMKIARALCKWVNSHPQASKKQMGLALEWAERVKKTTRSEDVIWLDWDMAILLRQRGEFHRAAEILADVIKSKRNEFWVWSEAGRLYQSEQPDLALACFCRALECSAEPKFLVRTHRELAELLAHQEEYSQASREVAITVEIRQTQGWPVGTEMEALIAKSWYDPLANGAQDPKEFYAKHSPAALALCFDVVETKGVNFLCLFVPQAPKDARPGWKPKQLTRFAVRDSGGKAWSLIGPGMRKVEFDAGAPLTLVVGRQHGDDRQTVIHVAERLDGTRWDCLESGAGVIARKENSEQLAKIFIVGFCEEVSVELSPEKSMSIGDGVRFGMVRHPKKDRVEIFNVEAGDLPQKDVRRVHGQLRRHPNGFGFVDDAFVPPDVVESVDLGIVDVTGLAIYAMNRKKNELGWRVVRLGAAPVHVA